MVAGKLKTLRLAKREKWGPNKNIVMIAEDDKGDQYVLKKSCLVCSSTLTPQVCVRDLSEREILTFKIAAELGFGFAVVPVEAVADDDKYVEWEIIPLEILEQSRTNKFDQRMTYTKLYPTYEDSVRDGSRFDQAIIEFVGALPFFIWWGEPDLGQGELVIDNGAIRRIDCGLSGPATAMDFDRYAHPQSARPTFSRPERLCIKERSCVDLLLERPTLQRDFEAKLWDGAAIIARISESQLAQILRGNQLIDTVTGEPLADSVVRILLQRKAELSNVITEWIAYYLRPGWERKRDSSC